MYLKLKVLKSEGSLSSGGRDLGGRQRGVSVQRGGVASPGAELGGKIRFFLPKKPRNIKKSELGIIKGLIGEAAESGRALGLAHACGGRRGGAHPTPRGRGALHASRDNSRC